MLCRYCNTEKDAGEFYAQSGVKCKQCTLTEQKRRYQNVYRGVLSANRLTARMGRLLKRPTKYPNPTETDKAYAAGILDGEGCISLLMRGRRGGKTGGQYVMLVYLTNTSEPMVRWMQERWGGHVQYVAAMPEKNRREQWRLQVQSNRALILLDDTYKFLVAKRPQAKLARRFQRYLQVSGRKRTQRMDDVRRVFWTEIRRLNHRGLRPFDVTIDAV